MKNPCHKECKIRSPTCHGSCKEYAKFVKYRERVREKRSQQLAEHSLLIDSIKRHAKQ